MQRGPILQGPTGAQLGALLPRGSSEEGLQMHRSVTKCHGSRRLPWVLAALQLLGHLWQLLLSSDAAAIAFKLMMQLGLI